MSQNEFNFKLRIKKVLAFIEKNNLDYILITNLQNLYWLSGTGQYGVMLIHKKNEPVIFIRRNFFRAQEESKLYELVELKKTSQIIEYIKKENRNLDDLNIGMELDSLPASYYLNYLKLLKGSQIINIEIELRKLRMIKDQKEIEILREAGKIAQKAQERIPKILKPGIKEYEVAAEVMQESMKNKSMHFSIVNSYLENWFIVASGENLWTPSTFPVLAGNGHSNAIPMCYSDRTINKGDIVMCDYAILYKGYHADHARTLFLDPAPENFKKRYTILKKIYEEVVEKYLREGTTVNVIYNEMKKKLDEEKLGKFFQGDGYYYQGLGHGIGLELDEPPFITSRNDLELKENMVIALEPKIIIPEWGAIDLEDNFIIKKGKPERITNTKYLFE